MSVNSYEEADRLSVAGAGSREVESWALLELAKRLDRVRKEQQQQQNKDDSALAEVVRLNWRAWTIIQSSLLDENNPLTPELRGDLLSLCAFIDRHSTQLLSSLDVEKVQILIDINMHLAQGLRGERLSETEQAAIVKARVQEKDADTSEETGAQKQDEQTTLERATLEQTAGEAPSSDAPPPTPPPPPTPAPASVSVSRLASSAAGTGKERRKVETGVVVDL